MESLSMHPEPGTLLPQTVQLGNHTGEVREGDVREGRPTKRNRIPGPRRIQNTEERRARTVKCLIIQFLSRRLCQSRRQPRNDVRAGIHQGGILHNTVCRKLVGIQLNSCNSRLGLGGGKYFRNPRLLSSSGDQNTSKTDLLLSNPAEECDEGKEHKTLPSPT